MRRDVARPWRVPWRVASWTALIFAVPLVTFTTGVLIVDAGEDARLDPAEEELGRAARNEQLRAGGRHARSVAKISARSIEPGGRNTGLGTAAAG